jgi:hypothetical protein
MQLRHYEGALRNALALPIPRRISGKAVKHVPSVFRHITEKPHHGGVKGFFIELTQVERNDAIQKLFLVLFREN